MTIDPSWLIVYKGDIKLNRYVEMLQENGMLVPDPRLQAIADAWEQDIEGLRYQARINRIEWPELTDLLDALTEETDDE